MDTTPRTRLLAGLIAVTVLAVITLASVLTMLPPSPKPADAPAQEFSASRAFEHVQKIGEQVHVTGSDAATDVRGYIVDTLTGYGYDPQVRTGIGRVSDEGHHEMAYVHNVVAKIPGSSPSVPLIVMAHYDSVQVSHGANDDGSGVATLLETARALAAGPQLEGDVLLLFTDAEEACLCGAESFVNSDPLGAEGGVVLNVESRGSTGPSIMFETSVGNANLVEHYAEAVPYPVATSMAVEVYRIMPNNTDFTPFLLSERFTGLNSAYIDGSAVYHTPEDQPQYMNVGTLQAHGSNILALVQNLGDADLAALSAPAASDATYFPVLGTLVIYSSMWVWPLAILALLAVAGLAYLVRRRLATGWGRLAGGFGMMLVPILGAAVVAQLYWALLVAIRPAYGTMIDPWEPEWFRGAVCALVAVVTVGWYALWRKRFGPWGLAVGGLAWLALVGLAMAIITPGGSYLAVIPALVGAALSAVALVARPWWLRLASVTVSGAVAVVVLAPVVVLFFPALGLATGAAGAVMAALLGLAVLPVVEYLHPAVATAVTSEGVTPAEYDGASRPRPRRRWQPVAATATVVSLLVAAVFTVVGLADDSFDAEHPTRTQLMYAMDADSGQAWWVSWQDDAFGWMAQYVSERRSMADVIPYLNHESYLVGPAEPADLSTPAVTVLSDDSHGDSRTVTVAIDPQRHVRLVGVVVPDATVTAASVAVGDVSREAIPGDGGFNVVLHAVPDDGFTLTLTVAGTDPIALHVASGTTGLAGLPGFTPRPPNVGIAGTHSSELVLVSHRVTI